MRKPAALVLNFHGAGATAIGQERNSGLLVQAEKSNFITVTPQAAGQLHWWNLTRNGTEEIDDIVFVHDLLATLQTSLCIDPARIYATGISNGARFVSLLACELNDQLAAVAPVAGLAFFDESCFGEAPKPVLTFHGTADPGVRFNGQYYNGQAGSVLTRGVRTDLKLWADFNGCKNLVASRTIANDITLESYSNCDRGSDVQLYVIQGGGHTWPGAPDSSGQGPTTHSVSAAEIMWQFFLEHPKP